MKLVVVGGAPYASEYINRVRRAADPRVVFPGYVFGPGYWELQRGAYLFCAPTEVGGTHPVILEALAAGNCVLVNDYKPNAETVGGAGVYFSGTEGVPDLVRRAVLLAGLIGGTVYGLMALQAETLIRIWSDGTAAVSVQVLILYALAWTIVTPTHVMMLMVIASGRHRVIGAIVLTEALVNLVLSIVLVSIMGPLGAAVSSFVVILLDDLLILPVVAARALQTRTRPILLRSLGGALTGIGIAAAVNLVPLTGVEGLILRGGLALAALALAVAVLVPGSRALIAGGSRDG